MLANSFPMIGVIFLVLGVVLAILDPARRLSRLRTEEKLAIHFPNGARRPIVLSYDSPPGTNESLVQQFVQKSDADSGDDLPSAPQRA